MKILRHMTVIAVSLLILLGLPFFTSDYFRSLLSGNTIDAVSSATVTLDQPSGNYVVLINRDRRSDSETLHQWTDFFSGKETGIIFEDIRCGVIRYDTSGLEMAASYQSQLPENQMKIDTEDAMFLLSKAGCGRFDIIVMSEEAAESYSAFTLYENENTEVIKVKGGAR